ncbi:hypothetical protein [Caulobacter endophyticus]|uniref:hypothetical protein n=1 Tax=Caulobacter endophyticus TaxID=2172652 RepID=UPI00240FAD70|nr:hypothetical protein [Caulobacter endophyticus]MDG2530541.1 hypothetical protein [Caulobacter endophyticus]
MTARNGLGGARALLLTLLMVPAACAPSPEEQARRSIESGQAVAEIQTFFDARAQGLPLGQCAAVLTGVSPVEISDRTARLDTVRALVEAGLMEEVAGAPAGKVQLAPTRKAAHWFRERRRNRALPASIELCYARRKITRAWLVGEDGKTLNFAYRLVDAPAWTGDARMRAAFPFLEPALSREMVATGIAPFRDGRWFLDLADEGITLPGHDEGFYACPDGREHPDPGCSP